MSYTLSTMMELGTKAPDFALQDTITGQQVSRDEVRRPSGLVVMFICNHCPYVIHVFRQLVDLAAEYQKRDIGLVAISSNDVINYPLDSPDKMEIVGKVLQFSFPYLYDATQEVAKAYDAACTPDIFAFDQDLKLYYRGQLDDSRPGRDQPVTGKDLRNALDDMLVGKTPPEKQYPSGGCNIKWLKD